MHHGSFGEVPDELPGEFLVFIGQIFEGMGGGLEWVHPSDCGGGQGAGKPESNKFAEKHPLKPSKAILPGNSGFNRP
jgi:hypothetical protein